MADNKKEEFKNFRAWIPIDTITKSKDANGNIVMKLGGLASTEDEDTDGEIIKQNLDTSYLKEKGVINWNHGKTPDSIVGEPCKVEMRKNGLYVESILYPDSSLAKSIYNLAQTLQKNSKTRRIGYSIEGKSLKRNDENPLIVEKAMITNLALTLNPKNKSSIVDIIKGNFNEFHPENERQSNLSPQEEVETLIKAFSAPEERKNIINITRPDGMKVTVNEDYDVNIEKGEVDSLNRRNGHDLLHGSYTSYEPLSRNEHNNYHHNSFFPGDKSEHSVKTKSAEHEYLDKHLGTGRRKLASNESDEDIMDKVSHLQESGKVIGKPHIVKDSEGDEVYRHQAYKHEGKNYIHTEIPGVGADGHTIATHVGKEPKAVNIEKSLMAGDTSGTETSNQATPGSGASIKKESVDGSNRIQHRRRKNENDEDDDTEFEEVDTDHNGGTIKELEKAEVYEEIFKSFPGIGFQKAQKIYDTLNNLTMAKNTVISDDLLEKALSSLKKGTNKFKDEDEIEMGFKPKGKLADPKKDDDEDDEDLPPLQDDDDDEDQDDNDLPDVQEDAEDESEEDDDMPSLKKVAEEHKKMKKGDDDMEDGDDVEKGLNSHPVGMVKVRKDGVWAKHEDGWIHKHPKTGEHSLWQGGEKYDAEPKHKTFYTKAVKKYNPGGDEIDRKSTRLNSSH